MSGASLSLTDGADCLLVRDMFNDFSELFAEDGDDAIAVRYIDEKSTIYARAPRCEMDPAHFQEYRPRRASRNG